MDTSIQLQNQKHQRTFQSTFGSISLEDSAQDITPSDQDSLFQENLKLNMRLQELEGKLLKQASKINLNDTSSNFELPSEFKYKWDNLVQDLLLDAFGDFYDRYWLLIPIVQLSLQAASEIVQQKLNSKMSNVLTLLNLRQESTSTLSGLLKPLLQNNYKEIFQDESLSQKFIEVLSSKVTNTSSLLACDRELVKTFIEEEDQHKAITEFFLSLKNILLYMKINEPPILLELIPLPEIEEYNPDYYQLFNYENDTFYCIDGFPKASLPSVIILNSPKMSSGGSFAGIKPSVLVLAEVPSGYTIDIVDYSQQSHASLGQEVALKAQKVPDSPKTVASSHPSQKNTSLTFYRVSRDKIHSPKGSQALNLSIEKINKVELQRPVAHLGDKGVTSCEKVHAQKPPAQPQTIFMDFLNKTQDNRRDSESYYQLTEANDDVNPNQLSFAKEKIRSMSRHRNTSQYFNNKSCDQGKGALTINTAAVAQHQRDHTTTKPQKLEIDRISRPHMQSHYVPSQQNVLFQPGISQSIYENMSLIDKGMIGSSRYVQCSLNFSKYLRSIVSLSPSKRNSADHSRFVEEAKDDPGKGKPQVVLTNQRVHVKKEASDSRMEEVQVYDSNQNSCRQQKPEQLVDRKDSVPNLNCISQTTPTSTPMKNKQNRPFTAQFGKPNYPSGSNENKRTQYFSKFIHGSPNHVHKTSDQQYTMHNAGNSNTKRTPAKAAGGTGPRCATSSKQHPLPHNYHQQNKHVRKNSPMNEKILKQGPVLTRKPSATKKEVAAMTFKANNQGQNNFFNLNSNQTNFHKSLGAGTTGTKARQGGTASGSTQQPSVGPVSPKGIVHTLFK